MRQFLTPQSKRGLRVGQGRTVIRVIDAQQFITRLHQYALGQTVTQPRDPTGNFRSQHTGRAGLHRAVGTHVDATILWFGQRDHDGRRRHHHRRAVRRRPVADQHDTDADRQRDDQQGQEDLPDQTHKETPETRRQAAPSRGTGVPPVVGVC